MRDFPLAEARRIYRAKYWDAVRADELPAAVRFDVFDAAINSGPAQAIRWLQRAIGVRDDGVVGPATIAAARTFNGSALAARFNGTRLEFMASLPTWSTFGRGWARRIATNLRNIT
jgi:lysozyme family protein